MPTILIDLPIIISVAQDCSDGQLRDTVYIVLCIKWHHNSLGVHRLCGKCNTVFVWLKMLLCIFRSMVIFIKKSMFSEDIKLYTWNCSMKRIKRATNLILNYSTAILSETFTLILKIFLF